MGFPTVDVEWLEGPSALTDEHLPVRTTETAVMEGLGRRRPLAQERQQQLRCFIRFHKCGTGFDFSPLPLPLLFQ